MGSGKKMKLQCLIFDVKFFPNKVSVKNFIMMNDYKIDSRLKYPIMRCDSSYRVRQRNPAWFNKKTFKTQSLSKGVKAVYGRLRR